MLFYDHAPADAGAECYCPRMPLPPDHREIAAKANAAKRAGLTTREQLEDYFAGMIMVADVMQPGAADILREARAAWREGGLEGLTALRDSSVLLGGNGARGAA